MTSFTGTARRWPELIEELLPEECTKVYIEEGTDGSRTVRIVEQENL